MATFRVLLSSLQQLSDEQLDQEVMIIPTGYCNVAEASIDGYSPYKGNVYLSVSKGDVIFDETDESPMCGGGVSGCSDVEEWDTPASVLAETLAPGEELYSKEDVVIGPGMPYIRISDKD